MPSFILIRQTVWPQYTNVTDRRIRGVTIMRYMNLHFTYLLTDRTDRQRSDSTGRNVLQTVAQLKIKKLLTVYLMLYKPKL